MESTERRRHDAANFEGDEKVKSFLPPNSVQASQFSTVFLCKIGIRLVSTNTKLQISVLNKSELVHPSLLLPINTDYTFKSPLDKNPTLAPTCWD